MCICDGDGDIFGYAIVVMLLMVCHWDYVMCCYVMVG